MLVLVPSEKQAPDGRSAMSKEKRSADARRLVACGLVFVLVGYFLVKTTIDFKPG